MDGVGFEAVTLRSDFFCSVDIMCVRATHFAVARYVNREHIPCTGFPFTYRIQSKMLIKNFEKIHTYSFNPTPFKLKFLGMNEQ
jgi:hypothetical protein